MLSKITTVMCYAHERGCNSLEGLSTVFCDTERSEFFGGLCFCDPEESLRPGSNLALAQASLTLTLILFMGNHGK